MSGDIKIGYSCRHTNSPTTVKTCGNLSAPSHGVIQKQYAMPIHCYNCVHARRCTNTLSMSGVRNTHGLLEQALREEEFDQEAFQSRCGYQSDADYARDFGTEEAMYRHVWEMVGEIPRKKSAEKQKKERSGEHSGKGMKVIWKIVRGRYGFRKDKVYQVRFFVKPISECP
jgi:hypothetical protein